MSLTTLAVAAAVEQAAGSPDGVRQSFEVLFEGALSQHTRLPLLDDVFKAFMDTNRHKREHYLLSDLLSINNKRIFSFEHLSIPYMATVNLLEGHDINWINIKLCNSSFQYIPKLGPLISRHKSDSWVALAPGEVLQQFPFLSAAVRSQYGTARVYYNYPKQRLELKLYPRNAATPGLMVTYKPGYPDMDDHAPLGNIPSSGMRPPQG